MKSGQSNKQQWPLFYFQSCIILYDYRAGLSLYGLLAMVDADGTLTWVHPRVSCFAVLLTLTAIAINNRLSCNKLALWLSQIWTAFTLTQFTARVTSSARPYQGRDVYFIFRVNFLKFHHVQRSLNPQCYKMQLNCLQRMIKRVFIVNLECDLLNFIIVFTVYLGAENVNKTATI